MAINPVLQTGLLNQSSAQVIDGSLRFDDDNKNYLTRTPGTVGNKKTFTFSTWTKGLGNATFFCNGVAGSGDNGLYIMITAESFYVGTWTSSWQWYVDTNRLFRDDGWYHLVVSVDTTIASPASDRVKLYVNGVQETSFATANYPSQDYDTLINNTAAHAIGRQGELDSHYLDKKLSQVYFIDGQQLGPEYFGFTDPLTNTWRPKKYTGTFTQSSPNNGTTWTNNTTSGSGTIGNAYDGDSSTWCNITSGNTFTLTLPKTIVADTVEVWLDTDTPASFSINGGTFSSENTYSGLQFVSVATDVSLTSLAIKGGSGGSGIGLRGIRINGEILLDGLNNTGANSFYLPMDGNSPIGEDKSGIVTPNNGSIWSSFLTSSTGFRSSEPQQNAFDGDTSSICSAVGSGTITFTSPVTFASNSTIRVFLHGGNHTVTVNGGSNQTISAGSFQTVTYSNSGNANFVMTFHRGGGADTGVRAIEIDGVILMDGQIGNNWKPVNFGSAELEKATGAKPILNTIHGGAQAGVGVFGSKEGFSKTVNSTSGNGNPYIFDTAGGTSTQPTLNMLRGATYSFDYSSATGHPLYFSSLSDGKHNSKAYSVQFDGTDDRLAVGSSSDYAFGTGDFTIEMFVYHTSLSGQQTYFSDQYSDQDGVYFYKTSNNTLSLYDNNNQVFTSGTIELNKWHHIALSRSSGVIRGFIDGVKVAEVADAHNYTETQYNIGDSHGSSSGEMVGYISNVRVLKGTGLYSSSFTPPQTTLTNITNTVLLCCQDSDATTAVVVPSGQSITTAGNPSATNSHNPFVYNDVHGNFGVNTATSNITKFTVPHLAVDTLYYYCTNHSGMGNSISVTTDETKADPYAWKCVLALPLLGTKDDVSASINVNSTTKTTAITGNTQGVYNTSVFYGGSFVFDGNSDYIQITPTDSSTLADSIGSYTIEFFFNIDSVRLGDNTYNIMWSTSSGLTIAKWRSGISNKVYFESDGNATGWNVTSNEDIRANNWYHFAAVRDGTTIKTYLNGVLQGTKTATYTASAETWWRVGGQNANSSTHDGYMQDFRIYRGVAKYTSNFMPPSINPDILPDTPSGVSGSSKLTKITDGAVSFDGSGDSLKIPYSADWTLGTTWTIEAFIYLNAISNGYSIIASQHTGGNAGTKWMFAVAGTGNGTASYRKGLEWYSSGGQINSSGNPVIDVGKWYHVAISCNSGTATMYVDGQSVGSGSVGTIPTTSDPLYIGHNSQSGNELNGFISNLRIVKGTAVYSGNFTPPTTPLTNITNTKLLCCQSNTSAIATAVLPVTAPNTSNWSARSNWNSGGTLTNASSYPLTAAFDGNLNTTFAMSYAGGMIWTAPATISFSSSIEVYVNSSIGTGGQGFIATISGVQQSKVDLNAAGSWETLYSGSGTFDKLEITRNNGGNNNNLWISAIRVDGTVLVDAIAANGDAAATNFNPFNTDINTVRGQETGYCTLNPLDTIVTLKDGNLETSTSSGWQSTRATIGMKSGKFYWETQNNQDAAAILGISNDEVKMVGGEIFGSNANPAWTWAGANYYFNSSTAGTGLSNHGTSDIVQYAFDADAGNLWFGRNGNWYSSSWATTGDPANGVNPTVSGINTAKTYVACASFFNGSAKFNFGQKPFKFPPPDGYGPINAANVRPETVITRPDQYFNTTLWSGDDADPRQIDLGMTPDLIWVKTRNQTNWHWLSDTLRGTADKRYKLYPNDPTAEDTAPIYGQADSFNDFGFVAGGGTHNTNPLSDSNQSGTNYVCWSWKAGGSKGTFNIDGEGYANASDVNMSVGALDNVALDKSATWSSSLTASNGFISGSYDATKAFNGFTSGNHSGTNSGGTLTFSPNLTIPANSIIEVYAGSAESALMDITVNGVANNSTPGGRFVKVNYDNSTTLTSLTVYRTGGGNSADLRGIRINGKLLVDSGVSINAPSIAATGCSVGTRQGFSIIKYEGDGSPGTIPHGLTQAPNFAIVKNREESESWGVYHSAQGGTKYAFLNSDNNFSSSSALWNDTDPTSLLFSLGDYNGTNKDDIDFIAYLWHDVPGLQKFGSYVATGDPNGAYIELGFRPRFIICKSASSNSRNWMLFDSSRTTYNPMGAYLTADGNGQEGTYAACDFLSNGFKVRATSAQELNLTNETYVYAAWAEAPAFNLYGAQSNAR